MVVTDKLLVTEWLVLNPLSIVPIWAIPVKFGVAPREAVALGAMKDGWRPNDAVWLSTEIFSRAELMLKGAVALASQELHGSNPLALLVLSVSSGESADGGMVESDAVWLSELLITRRLNLGFTSLAVSSMECSWLESEVFAFVVWWLLSFLLWSVEVFPLSSPDLGRCSPENSNRGHQVWFHCYVCSHSNLKKKNQTITEPSQNNPIPDKGSA